MDRADAPLLIYHLVENYASFPHAVRRVLRLQSVKGQGPAIFGICSCFFVFVYPRHELGHIGLCKLENDAYPRLDVVAVLPRRQERPRLHCAEHFLQKRSLPLDDPYVRDLSSRIHSRVQENLSPRKRLRRERCRYQRKWSRTREALSILR